MIALIRRITNSVRLEAQLSAAENRISILEDMLKAARSGPCFAEVAKDFDVSHIHAEAIARVVDDLSPMLEQEAISLLKQGMHRLVEDHRGPSMIARSAYEMTNCVYQLEFRVPAMGTVVQSVRM